MSHAEAVGVTIKHRLSCVLINGQVKRTVGVPDLSREYHHRVNVREAVGELKHRIEESPWWSVSGGPMISRSHT